MTFVITTKSQPGTRAKQTYLLICVQSPVCRFDSHVTGTTYNIVTRPVARQSVCVLECVRVPGGQSGRERESAGRTADGCRVVLLRALCPGRAPLRARGRGQIYREKNAFPFGVRRSATAVAPHGPCPTACSDFPSVIRESVTVGSFSALAFPRFPPFSAFARVYFFFDMIHCAPSCLNEQPRRVTENARRRIIG